MDGVHIGELTARYRLPARAREARRRLDAILDQVLGEALEPALERLGIAAGEEVCIRHVEAPVRLRLSAPDRSLVEAWSTALADAVRRALAGDGGVAHYSSRVHALVDLLTSVAAFDRERAWAWRQLGLWRAGDHADDATAIGEAVRALREEPQAIVPVLREAARRGALAGLSRQLTAEAWIALARAALVASGVPPSLAGPDAVLPAPSPATAREAERVVRAAPLAAEASIAVAQCAGATHALAALVILDAEPAALRATGARQQSLMAAVAAVLGASPAARARIPAADAGIVPRPDDASDVHPRIGPAPTVPASAPAAPPVVAPDPAPRARARPTFPEADGRTDPAAREAVNTRATDSQDLLDGPGDAGAPGSSLRAGTGERRVLEPVRQRSRTAAGGLLFLLHLVRELELPDEIMATEPLASRGLRWALHRLAVVLAGVDASDPAALAFAGLGPRSDPPSRTQAPATDGEVDALHAIAARVIERLREYLAGTDVPLDEQLAWVCRRGAEIVADPGWIEARFPLDQVSTELRRVGLDLDPGYVPWLGVVLRFVYA